MFARPFLLIFLLVIASYTKAQEENFSADNIPKELLKHANAVVRKYHTEISIVSKDEVYVSVRYAITILNEKGGNHAAFHDDYDNLKKIESVRGWLYDEHGNEIEKMKKPDLKDVSSSSDNLYDEERVKVFDFNCTQYPYTCVFEEKIKYNTTFIIPEWSPQNGYDCAVENADIAISYPRDFGIRYRTYHIKNAPIKTTEEERDKLTFTVSSVPARAKPDGFTPHENYPGPTVVCVANTFVLDELTENVINWNDFGKFFYDLNANRDELPDNIKKVVHQLTDTCKGTYEKVKLLYEYLQKNERYVSIMLGVGGWRTWDAKYVAEKGYGDCKALSNYMKALLREAGVTAYAVLVNGGEHPRRMEADFACNVFNHAILCVPEHSDTLWLECTSKDFPAGYLSPFTADRNVLLVSPAGGFMVKTPAYDERVNTVARKAVLSINDKDEVSGSVDAQYRGSRWEREFSEIGGKTETEDYFNKKFAIPTYKVNNYTIHHTTIDRIPEIHEHIQLTGTGCTGSNGRQLYVSPHIFKLSIATPPSFEARNDSFQLPESYQVSDTTIISLPGSYQPVTALRNIDHDFPFASFHSRMVLEGDNTVKIYVFYKQKKGVYPPAMFDDYIRLSKEINGNAAYEKVALIKKS